MQSCPKQLSVGTWLIVVVVLVQVLSGSGCTPSYQEMPGVYLADYGFATDRLVLRPDFTFRQEVWIKSTNQRYATNGLWYLDRAEGYVIFSGAFLFTRDGFGRPLPQVELKTGGLVILPAIRRFGRQQIGDLPGIPYYKQRVKP